MPVPVNTIPKVALTKSDVHTLFCLVRQEIYHVELEVRYGFSGTGESSG